MHVRIAPTEISSLLYIKHEAGFFQYQGQNNTLNNSLKVKAISCRTDTLYNPIEFTPQKGCDILAIIANDDMNL
jgi:hypothetical protein